MAERRFVFNGAIDFSSLEPMHDGRVSHVVHFRILSRCHKFSLSAHKTVNCSPYKPTVNPRPQSKNILVGAAIILLNIFTVGPIIILQLDIAWRSQWKSTFRNSSKWRETRRPGRIRSAGKRPLIRPSRASLAAGGLSPNWLTAFWSQPNAAKPANRAGSQARLLLFQLSATCPGASDLESLSF